MRAWVFGLALAWGGSAARAQVMDDPTASVWSVTRSWDAAAEAEFGRFVTTLGRAVAAHRCTTLRGCLQSRSVNPLWAPSRRPLRFRGDCADVPYILRAYFAWRTHRPFVFTSRVRTRSVAPHAPPHVEPMSTLRWDDYASPRALFNDVASVVRSWFFRSDAATDRSDFYPVAIDRRWVRPGTVFYDPDGHVLVVYEVLPSGEVLMVDGHPDSSFTARRFSETLTLGTARTNGGFQNFRPILLGPGGRLSRPASRALPDYDPLGQYDAARRVVDGHAVGYHAWVRGRLRERPPRAGR
ncbi:MAG: hypothetical protein HY909_16455 [Deltaproteobacteria bacterium]|nr:hypothetical protein [Deltaproteobacteria bacterium]